jgi:uncharacterized damage-inducible protein DinB
MPDKTFEQLLRYNNWANDALFTVFDGYGERMPAACLRLLCHIENAQTIWLSRMNPGVKSVGVWDEHDLETCRRMQELTAAGFKAVLEKHGGDLNTLLEYTNSRGMAFSNTIFDMLLQAFTHGGYHRGQIAMEMRRAGLEPTNTDYIVFLRATGMA